MDRRWKNIYEAFLKELNPVFSNLPFSVAEENIQSRTRGNLLMAIANKFGYILLNTSNKSELATGYGTLYGDMAGGLGVLGDCYKLQVYELAKYINRTNKIIPVNIITKPPSAELRPNQKDSDSLPDYQPPRGLAGKNLLFVLETMDLSHGSISVMFRNWQNRAAL